MDTKITGISLRKMFDSSGNFTVEATVALKSSIAVASAPSGKSKGKTEVASFPEGNVDTGIGNFKHLEPKLVGESVEAQGNIDAILNDNVVIVGGNVTTAVSIAVARAAATCNCMELFEYVHGKLTKKFGMGIGVPRPLGNVIGGGLHSLNSGMSVQEILVATESQSAEKNVAINSELHKTIGQYALKHTTSPVGVNIERAWVLPFDEIESLEIVSRLKSELEEKYGVKITMAMDLAASSIYREGKYAYGSRKLSTVGQIEFAAALNEKYGVGILEDPFDEEDYASFAKLNKAIGRNALIVGDDLYTTNAKRIEEGAKMHATNAVLVKVNQIGTLTETIRAVAVAVRNDMATIISHRSSETTDPFIAHLGTAFGSKYIKTGTVGGERIAKLNELMRIDNILNG